MYYSAQLLRVLVCKHRMLYPHSTLIVHACTNSAKDLQHLLIKSNTVTWKKCSLNNTLTAAFLPDVTTILVMLGYSIRYNLVTCCVRLAKSQQS